MAVVLVVLAARAAVLAAMVPFLVPVTNSILGKRPGKQKEQQEYLWTAVSAGGCGETCHGHVRLVTVGNWKQQQQQP